MIRAFLLLISMCTSVDAQWYVIRPVKQAHPQLGSILADIESHLPNGHPYRSADLDNWAHEATHGINSRVRQSFPDHNAFYCFMDQALVLREPKILLASIPRSIPPDHRGEIFNLTFVQMSGHWNDCPLYVLDEWTAYTNCSAVVVQRKLDSASSIRFMLEFNSYATALLQEVLAHDPNYPDKELLMQFVGWNILRTFEIADAAKKVPGLYDSRTEAIRQRFASRYMEAQL